MFHQLMMKVKTKNQKNLHMYRWTFCCLLLVLSTNVNAQKYPEVKSDTIDYPLYNVIYGDSIKSKLSFEIQGTIVEYERGECGKFCSGAVLKVKLSKKNKGYKYRYVMLMVSPCMQLSVGEKVNYKIWLLKSDEAECYLKKRKTIINPDSLPFYRCKT